ncbi:translocation/assembly module TamB domain-containing protein [Pseudocnuella soli]|uniref:translocation/assembly module TamB domain-containing protein n=1 Tax=Pseudocnuella soli TaxID=2502779 RepID=UPI00104B8E97|nr:translocation/assembly module TamB [Pseudocnuella soli]
MQTEANTRPVAVRILRILLKSILFLLLFVVVIFLLILTPPVQSFLTGRAESFLEKKLQTRVDIGAVRFGLSGKISLQDVYIEDRSKDTLVSGGSIKTRLALRKLLNNELEINYLELENITAKIKRVLPDTTFNFQFIVDAFTPKTTTVDTTTTAPMKMALDRLTLDNVVFQMADDVTGSNMRVRIGGAEARMDSINPAAFYYDIPSVQLRNVTANIRQYKPLATPEPLSKDIADAVTPQPMQLKIGQVDLSQIAVNFANDVSAFYTDLNLGRLQTTGRQLNLSNNTVHLENLLLENTTAVIRMGKSAGAKVVEKEVAQEVEAQQVLGYDFRVGQLRLNNNNIKFDNDNEPRAPRGMDYAHLDAKALTLHADGLVITPDSMAARISRGSVQEKSGFNLQELQGNLLYAYNGAHLQDLYIKTPGTELRRDLTLKYSSFEALMNNFPQTQMDVNIDDSRIKVADILTFAPMLAAQPAFRNANDTWYVDLQARGSMNDLLVNNLQFSGMGNTSISASGRLTNLTNPDKMGADFTVNRLRTTKSDLQTLSGGAIPEDAINLPQNIDLDGTIRGSGGNLATNVNLRTSAGSAAIRGTFANITNPSAARYDATVQARGLQLGSILRNPQLGSLTGTVRANGVGFTPESMRTNFSGVISNAGFNGYNYRNIDFKGNLAGTEFSATLDSRDANAAFDLTASGDFGGAAPAIKLSGMIDSLKTMPLGFTTEPLIFRGRIAGDMPSLDPNAPQADVQITEALFVTGANRLNLDTLQLQAGGTDSGQYIRVQSDIINAAIEGQYRLTELAAVFQQNLAPYINLMPAGAPAQVQPYDFTFRADVQPSPIIGAFVPGMEVTSPINIDGRLATGSGMQANVVSDGLVFAGSTLTGINIQAYTEPQGLQIRGELAGVQSGGIVLHRTSITATALNNNINFGLNLRDNTDRSKYMLAGLFQMEQSGINRLSLSPDSLMLNYNSWSIAPNNQIVLAPTYMRADNFVLSQGAQRLELQSGAGNGVQPLTVTFDEFQLATLTGFIQEDSLFADGRIDGVVTFPALPKQILFTSDLTIADLAMQNDTIGNLRLQVLSQTPQRYDADVVLSGRGNDARITGSMTQLANDIGLDLNVALQQLQLSTFEGAMEAFVTRAAGTISGNMRIAGTASKPDIDGGLRFNQVSLNTVAIGGPFNINDEELRLNNDGLVFDGFSILDTAGQALNIDGTVKSSNFINYAFDLDVNADNFKALSTVKQPNALYYGDLVISTRMHVGGTETAPEVDGQVTVEEATNFSIVIPQAEAGVVSRDGVVEFVDFDAPLNDSLFRAYDSINTSSLVGFDVAANITITKEANFNLVVDVANGDFLNIRGEGQLSGGIDPSGKITLTGTYTVEEGAYRFSFNFLQRRFDLQKGSTITWMGEPTNAQLDMTAVYIANTAPLDLVEAQVEQDQRNFYLQKLPFNVLLNLDGEMLKPVLTFDITLPKDQNYNVGGDVVQTVDYRLAQLRQEPSELNKQVFAILLLNRFVGENPFGGGEGGGFNAETFARQSVSKLLTEQLNNLAGDLIAGVDLNFGVTSSDDYATGNRRTRTDLNVGLSKRLLNDRLTVNVGSDFMLEGAQQSNQRSSNIAGNVAINYQLSRDGRYALRFYRRNEYEAELLGHVIETGLGFIMTVDYNRVRQIFESTKKKEERRKQWQLQREIEALNAREQEPQTEQKNQ